MNEAGGRECLRLFLVRAGFGENHEDGLLVWAVSAEQALSWAVETIKNLASRGVLSGSSSWRITSVQDLGPIEPGE